MTERTFRLVVGAILLFCLYYNFQTGIHILMAVLLLEGITNYRIPKIISLWRFGHGTTEAAPAPSPSPMGQIEAERVLRLLIVGFLFISQVLFVDTLWFFPWFIGFALIGAGLSGLCPMVLGLKWLGFS